MAFQKIIAATVFSLTLLLIGHRPARAASYVGTYTVDPATLSCGYYVSEVICGSYTALATPIYLNVGDQVNETVNYTSAVTVPGSNSENVAYIGLPDYKTTSGPPLPGPLTATVSTQLIGYTSTATLPPIAAPYSYVENTLDTYIAIAGFCCGYGAPSPAFTITGANSNFQISTTEALPVTAVSYGYAYDLPSPVVELSGLPGGTVDSPVLLPAGPSVGQITGNISGSASAAQFYSFYWGGGLMQTNASITGADAGAEFQFQIFSIYGTAPIEGVTSPVAAITLNASDNFAGLLSKTLSGGEYEIGLYTDGTEDPAFTIHFDTPITSAAPEPSTWMLIIAGLSIIGGMLRIATTRCRENEVTGIATA